MEKGTFGLRFGALVFSIKKQLEDQGLKFDKDAIAHFQKDADAVARLRIRGIIPLSIARKAEQKIIKGVSQSINP